MSVVQAIESLKSISPEIVALPGSDEFDKSIKGYLSGLQAALKPAAFALPRDRKEVSEIIKALRPFADDIRIAVCGAGQQPCPGISNTTAGITIHTRRIRGINLNKDEGIISLAAGEQMKEVQKLLSKEGLGASGCRSDYGGIVGLATHGKFSSADLATIADITFTGGLSFFSSERGFISDDVANYEVVLANGDIVNANATENSDLFKALKGGGNNFGIITRIDFPTFPLGDFWGGKAFYQVSSYENQIDALVAYLNGPNPDPKLHVFINAGFTSWFPGLDRAAMNDVFYLEPRQGDAATSFANPEHTFHSTFSVGSLEKFSNEQASAYETNVRMIYMTTTLKADAEILKQSWRRFEKVGEATKDIEGFTFSIAYEPFPVSLMKQSAEKGGNNLGLDSSDGPLVLVLLYGGWKHAKDDERVLAESQKLLQEINKEAEAQGKSHPYRFMNYSFSNEDPIASYGSKQKQFLQDVSAKYDKEGFFQKTVGFKLNGFK